MTKPARPRSGFEELDLSPEMLRSLKRAEYWEPSPVQAGVIPVALDGHDVLGQAQTGTGKTAAFAIPIIELVDIETRSPEPQAIILVPTRELCVQVHDEFMKLAYGTPVKCIALYGGTPLRKQVNKLRAGANAIVGTPGRVIDHISRGTLRLHDVDMVVLDEADRMLDIGFRPDIERILRACPKDRQTLLLSATVPSAIDRISRRYMHDPIRLEFSPKTVAATTIEQFYFTVDHEIKFKLLLRLIDREDPDQMIVFCRTKRRTERIYKELSKELDRVGVIHGDLPQSARNRVMTGFRNEKIRFLVATDVVGRGIDVSTVSHIVNFDIPQYCDDYVHRVGRTGRMGREGVAYTFVTQDEGEELTKIEMRIDTLLQQDHIPGMKLVQEQVELAEEDLEPDERKEIEEKRAVAARFGRGRGVRRRRAL